MRWPAPGTVVATTRVVAAGDRAAFDDEDIHDVYSTVAMVRDVEHVSRWLFRQGLAEGEEGAGASITLTHMRPVPVGAVVELTATVRSAERRKMVTDVEVIHDGDVVATAEFTQVVIDPARWS